jgi:anaerobic dimethyl sulfoxide reductase subunit C (anchor subunit)
MGEYEIPLVIFTVLSQWAVGITLAVVLLELLKPKFMDTVGKKVLKTPIFIALGVSVVGTLASVLHLGSPFKSYTSIIGTSHSWLSREIIAVVLFNICLLALTYVWWKKVDQASLRKSVGLLTALIGVVTVISSATVYFSMALHPSWHNWTTFANFLLTGFLLGSVTVAYFALKTRAEESETSESVTKVLGIYLAIIVAALLVTIGSSAIISIGAAESQMAAAISFTSILFWVRILGSLLIPATLILLIMFTKKKVSVNYILLAAALVLVGELSGRMEFYHSVMSQYPWF